jgi:hypothetical protein
MAANWQYVPAQLGHGQDQLHLVPLLGLLLRGQPAEHFADGGARPDL